MLHAVQLSMCQRTTAHDVSEMASSKCQELEFSAAASRRLDFYARAPKSSLRSYTMALGLKPDGRRQRKRQSRTQQVFNFY